MPLIADSSDHLELLEFDAQANQSKWSNSVSGRGPFAGLSRSLLLCLKDSAEATRIISCVQVLAAPRS